MLHNQQPTLLSQLVSTAPSLDNRSVGVSWTILSIDGSFSYLVKSNQAFGSSTMLSMLKRSSRSPATKRLIFSVGAKLSPAFLPDDKKPRSRRHISGAAEPVISLIPLSGLLIMFRISLISNRLYELGDVHGRIDQVAHHTDHFDTDEIARESKGDESAERRVLDT